MTVDVLAYPRDRNPYQELLYGPMRQSGVRVGYLAERTPSHTLNVLGLPLELVMGRVAGYRIVHLHWTWAFVLPSPISRRVSRAWFSCVLRFAKWAGYKVVWTVHNVLPHAPVFDDDVRARITLVEACDLVIGHSAEAIADLQRIGATPARSAVITQGPPDLPGLRELGPPIDEPPRTVVFTGKVERYKGVEDLLQALSGFPMPLRVVVAGPCGDEALRRDLERAAAPLGERVTMRLNFQDDADLVDLIDSATALVFPFRSITTSSSVMLGLSAGRPMVVPELPALGGLPDDAVFRYPSGVDGLRRALERVATAPFAEIVARGRAAADYRGDSWQTIAETTRRAFCELIDPR